MNCLKSLKPPSHSGRTVFSLHFWTFKCHRVKLNHKRSSLSLWPGSPAGASHCSAQRRRALQGWWLDPELVLTSLFPSACILLYAFFDTILDQSSLYTLNSKCLNKGSHWNIGSRVSKCFDKCSTFIFLQFTLKTTNADGFSLIGLRDGCLASLVMLLGCGTIRLSACFSWHVHVTSEPVWAGADQRPDRDARLRPSQPRNWVSIKITFPFHDHTRK